MPNGHQSPCHTISIEKMGKILISSKCGDEFDEKTGRKAGKMNYCGYCEAVVFGSPGEFASWPPKVIRQEYSELKRTRGVRVEHLGISNESKN